MPNFYERAAIDGYVVESINLKTAKALSLDIPINLWQLADQLIE